MEYRVFHELPELPPPPRRLKSAHSCRICGHWCEGDWNSAYQYLEPAHSAIKARADREMARGACDPCAKEHRIADAVCRRFVSWWGSEYEGWCELTYQHPGDHYDGMSWFDDEGECTDDDHR